MFLPAYCPPKYVHKLESCGTNLPDGLFRKRRDLKGKGDSGFGLSFFSIWVDFFIYCKRGTRVFLCRGPVKVAPGQIEPKFYGIWWPYYIPQSITPKTSGRMCKILPVGSHHQLSMFLPRTVFASFQAWFICRLPAIELPLQLPTLHLVMQ